MPSIDVNGTRVSFREAGTGEPVVVLHCSASSGGQWRKLFERLSEHFNVLAPDLYSCGESDAWQGRGRLTLADEAAIVTALLRYRRGPVHLVGHSYGGALALRAALDHPDQIKTLTLVEPTAFHLLRHADGDAAESLGEIRAVANNISRAVLCGDYQGGMARFVDYWNGDGTWAQMDEPRRAQLAPRIGKVAVDFSALIGEETTPAAFIRVRMPSLVIRGDRSPAPARHVAEILERALPRATLETVEGAGHMLPITHAEEVNALIAEHLSDFEAMSAWIAHRSGEDEPITDRRAA